MVSMQRLLVLFTCVVAEGTVVIDGEYAEAACVVHVCCC